MLDYYPDPVTTLGRLGEPDSEDWLDYARYGIGPEHLPHLLVMVNDRALIEADESVDEAWAPIHALRAVAELQDPRAIEPLLAILMAHSESDWFAETALDGLTLIGQPTIEAGRRLLSNPGAPQLARFFLAEAMEAIGRRDPAARGAVIEALVEPFLHPDWHPPDLLSFVLMMLAELQADETLPVVGTAYNAGDVGREDFDSWEEVVQAFGEEPTLQRRIEVEGAPWPPTPPLYRIRVSLRGIEPEIWRLIELPGDATLCRLHHVIQAAFGWWNYHLYSFHTTEGEYTNLRLLENHLDPSKPPAEAAEARLVDVVPSAPSSLVYVYDYGDNWEHEVDVLEISDASVSRLDLPRCIDGARNGPREDCGGTRGYAEMLDALADPEHEERETWLGWAPGYDPEHFDLEEVNRRMRGTDWEPSQV